jgi:hypothetical protein
MARQSGQRSGSRPREPLAWQTAPQPAHAYERSMSHHSSKFPEISGVEGLTPEQSRENLSMQGERRPRRANSPGRERIAPRITEKQPRSLSSLKIASGGEGGSGGGGVVHRSPKKINFAEQIHSRPLTCVFTRRGPVGRLRRCSTCGGCRSEGPGQVWLRGSDHDQPCRPSHRVDPGPSPATCAGGRSWRVSSPRGRST